MKNISGDLITSPEDIASELNNTFIEMGTSDNGFLPYLDKRSLKTEDLNLVYFDELDIFNECVKLKPKFSLGPDNIPSILYMQLGGCLAQPLAIIFNLIMQYGVLPDIWRTAIVVQIYKKGPASNPKNYRPISLTCMGCKRFEKIIKTHLVSHFHANNLLNKEQHGFLTKRSTTTNLLELTYDLAVNFNEALMHLWPMLISRKHLIRCLLLNCYIKLIIGGLVVNSDHV